MTKHTEPSDDKAMEISAKTQPLELFAQWMDEARAHPHIREANAMAIATAAGNGEIHNRVVLCKSFSEEGFVFFTNYQSQKGQDLAASPQAGAVFYWDSLFRQVKLSGAVEKTSRADSEAYWRSRPRESQISQFISRQSQPAPSRAEIERLWDDADRRFAGAPIPCPEHWGGYLLRPKAIEFWVGLAGRLHDRHQFQKSGPGAWTYGRLYP